MTRQRGFTLIELMVALVVSSIVVLGIFAFSSIQQSTSGIHARNVRIQQALEGAMWSVGQDVRQSGLGFARLCTELRVWDEDENLELINPGGPLLASNATVDDVTGEAYWVLRDGVQAHWNSEVGTSLAGTANSSADPTSMADSLDVIVAEGAYVGSPGVFTLVNPVADGDPVLTVQTADILDSDDADHLDQVRQLFPPGTFLVIARTPPPNGVPSRPDLQGQCALLQVTGDVAAVGGTSPSQWQIPIADTSSFNDNLNELLVLDNNDPVLCDNGTSDCDDWVPGTLDNVAGSSVIGLGRLRWSRYEIDYTYDELPYLVRYDFIGWQTGDLDGMGVMDYPHCDQNTCRGAGLHLPGFDPEPLAVAIGPMIEDMQVAVGCDGYTIAGATGALNPIWEPDDTYEEIGPNAAPNPLAPNFVIDENDFGDDRNRDEWLGNADNELWAPDCVYYGTGEYRRDEWIIEEPDEPSAFRMSPQAVRVTLVGSAETVEEAGGLASDQILAVEDRGIETAPAGRKQRFSLTERFAPENLRWRDPTVR